MAEIIMAANQLTWPGAFAIVGVTASFAAIIIFYR